MSELEKFLEWLEREELSVCEPILDRGRWEGDYRELDHAEILARFRPNPRKVGRGRKARF